MSDRYTKLKKLPKTAEEMKIREALALAIEYLEGAYSHDEGVICRWADRALDAVVKEME